MSMHPAITAAVANQHRRDLITQADAYRLARTARQGRPRSQVSPFLTTKRVIITAAGGGPAPARFMLTPAGPAHASAHHVAGPAVTGHPLRGRKPKPRRQSAPGRYAPGERTPREGLPRIPPGVPASSPTVLDHALACRHRRAGMSVRCGHVSLNRQPSLAP
jgi:hypothetical protein